MKEKKVKIDKKVLFEICDAILHCEGAGHFDDYNGNWYCLSWDKDFYKKVQNIRNNS